MFEVALLLSVMLVIAAFAFAPTLYTKLFVSEPIRSADVYTSPGQRMSEDSGAKYSFLASIQTEVEEALFPPPTDSALRRHYDALIEAEVEERLAAMPDA